MAAAPLSFSKPKLLLGEGVDEVRFFRTFLGYLGLSDIQVESVGGKNPPGILSPNAYRFPGARLLGCRLPGHHPRRRPGRGRCFRQCPLRANPRWACSPRRLGTVCWVKSQGGRVHPARWDKRRHAGGPLPGLRSGRPCDALCGYLFPVSSAAGGATAREHDQGPPAHLAGLATGARQAARRSGGGRLLALDKYRVRFPPAIPPRPVRAS